MKIDYSDEFLEEVKAVFGEKSIQYAYAETGDERLGASISKHLNYQSCFINFSNKTKEEINEIIKQKRKTVKIDRLYDSWIEIVEKAYDERENSSTTRARIQA